MAWCVVYPIFGIVIVHPENHSICAFAAQLASLHLVSVTQHNTPSTLHQGRGLESVGDRGTRTMFFSILLSFVALCPSASAVPLAEDTPSPNVATLLNTPASQIMAQVLPMCADKRLAIVQHELNALSNTRLDIQVAFSHAVACISHRSARPKNPDTPAPFKPCSLAIATKAATQDSPLVRSQAQPTAGILYASKIAFEAYIGAFEAIISHSIPRERMALINAELDEAARMLITAQREYQLRNVAMVDAQFVCTEQEYLFWLHLRDANTALKTNKPFDIDAWTMEANVIKKAHQHGAELQLQLIGPLYDAMFCKILIERQNSYLETKLHSLRKSLEYTEGTQVEQPATASPGNASSSLASNAGAILQSQSVNEISMRISKKHGHVKRLFHGLEAAARSVSRVACFQILTHSRIHESLNGYSVLTTYMGQLKTAIKREKTGIVNLLALRAHQAAIQITTWTINNNKKDEADVSETLYSHLHNLGFPVGRPLEDTDVIQKYELAKETYWGLLANESGRRMRLAIVSQSVGSNISGCAYAEYNKAVEEYTAGHLNELRLFLNLCNAEIDVANYNAELLVTNLIAQAST